MHLPFYRPEPRTPYRRALHPTLPTKIGSVICTHLSHRLEALIDWKFGPDIRDWWNSSIISIRIFVLCVDGQSTHRHIWHMFWPFLKILEILLPTRIKKICSGSIHKILTFTYCDYSYTRNSIKKSSTKTKQNRALKSHAWALLSLRLRRVNKHWWSGKNL